MKVTYMMGPHEETVTLPDNLSDDEIQEDFEAWLWNRSDIGWHKEEDEDDGRD